MEKELAEEIIARCGYRCDLCLAYKENIRSSEDRRRISDGWFKYYGFRIPSEKIRCDGCLTEDRQNPKRMDPNCPVRPCVLEKGLENCAYCSEYICETLKTRAVIYEEVAEQFEAPIPQEDYEAFIRPYEGEKTLGSIRESRTEN
ncbi:MAG: hypothetical protein A2Y73_07840 [Chloroflexi bacterium RBG_13_56_8]|nr:MAG: hypothetical protein A2Y73_07840 [Chloroflexi bacterium RBG_13_56_8]